MSTTVPDAAPLVRAHRARHRRRLMLVTTAPAVLASGQFVQTTLVQP